MLKIILIFLFPLLVFAQEFDLDNLELGDVDLPAFKEIEILEGPKRDQKYPSTIIKYSESPGGIHEKLVTAKYGKKNKIIDNNEIIWDDDIYPSNNEPNYFYFGIGPGALNYTGSGQDLKANASSEFTLSLDLFGAYWPLYSQKFMFGTLLNLLVNQFSMETYNVSQFQLTASISLYYFLGANIGSGVYLRGDLGFGMVPILTTGSDSKITSSYLWGGNWLIGAGYAFPFWRETRLLLGFNMSKSYTSFSGVGDSNNAYVVSIGALF